MTKGIPIVPINKVKMFYFFSEDVYGLQQYLKYYPILEIRLLRENTVMATCNLDLSSHVSPVVNQKSYYEVMPGKQFKGFL